MIAAHPIPDEALDSDIAILGRKGGGKTYTSKGIVERLLDLGRRVLILDPLGVWAGLRTSADGQKAGYKVAIFGGLHADMALDPAAAEPLARIIAKENLPAVIDLSELSKGAQQAFLLKFLHELRRVNTEALTLVLEEADVFAPQNPQGDDSKQLHGEIDWISRRGRFKGFRLISICQRPARLSKDVLTQANMLIMHRLPSPQDQGAGMDWIKSNGDLGRAKEVESTLGSLKVGEAWVLAQEPSMLERAMFPKIKTLDTSATPKAGEKRIEPKTLAQVDVSAIKAALQAAAPASKGKTAAVTKATADELAEAEHRGYQRGYEAGHPAGVIAGIAEARRKLIEFAETFSPDETRVTPHPALVHSNPPFSKMAPRTQKAINHLVEAAVKQARPVSDMAANPFYQAAVSIHPVRMTWGQLGTLAQRKAHGGSFNTAKKRLLEEGYLVEREGLVAVVNPPIDAGGGVPADLLEERLPAVPRDMFKAIRAHKHISIPQLADYLGKAAHGGSWNTGMSILRKNELVLDRGGFLEINPELLG